MKRRMKSLAVLLVFVMVVAALGGCSSKSSDKSDSKSSTIYGEVTEVGENSIKINVGTMKDMGKPDEQNQNNDDADNKDNTNVNNNENADELKDTQGMPSIIDLTGEEKEIKVSDDTKITKEQMMGGPFGGNMGTPPQMPDGNNQNSDEQGTPPAMPDNNNQNGGEQGTPPAMPDGNNQGGPQQNDSDNNQKSSQNNDANTEEISLSDISVGDIVKVTLNSDGNATEIVVIFSAKNTNGQPGGGQQASGVDSYTAVNEYNTDKTVKDKTIKSTGTDENAVLVSGGNVTLEDVTITRKSSDSTGGDNSSFYGVGAAVLTTDGTSYIKNSKIDTDASGGAGIFAYNKGTSYVADTTIKTTQDASGGIHVAGGGTLYAWNLSVETNGGSAAAIRSDRGGGTMVVDGGSYTSNGSGSPAIYSTADITVNDADLTANGSEAICIEGMNSIRLFNSNLTGNMSDNSQNDCTWNVILYQSMSGDAAEGNATFEMDGGTLTAKNGGMFYTTNTESTFVLNNVDITYADENDFFLKCTGNSNQRGWGTSGENGADCSFTAINQKMEGDIIWDSISKLDFHMTDKSTLKGAIKDDESNAGDGGDGYCNIYIEKGSTWIVTGNSTVTNLYNAGTIKDASGKKVTIKGTDGKVYVRGNSKYTVTVDSYSKTADVKKASSISKWSDYKVEKPTQLD